MSCSHSRPTGLQLFFSDEDDFIVLQDLGQIEKHNHI